MKFFEALQNNVKKTSIYFFCSSENLLEYEDVSHCSILIPPENMFFCKFHGELKGNIRKKWVNTLMTNIPII